MCALSHRTGSFVAGRCLGLLLGLALLTGCGSLARDATSLAPGGVGFEDAGSGVSELVPAAVETISLPSSIIEGEALVLSVKGTHLDPCTRFERFESEATGQQLRLKAWAIRPLGGCAGVGETFEASSSLQGLKVGIYELIVNDLLSASVSVLAPPRPGAPCSAQVPVSLVSASLPQTSHPLGRAILELELELESTCDHLLAPSQTQVGDVLELRLDAEGCPLTRQDPQQCPGGPKRVQRSIPLQLATLGLTRVALNGQALGSVELVPTSSCRLSHAHLRALQAPGRIEAQRPFSIQLQALLPSSCAAFDDAVLSQSASQLSLQIPVRECASACASQSREASLSLPMQGLAEGSYTLQVESLAPRPLEVLPQGSCAAQSLPPGSLHTTLLTSGLSSTVGRAGQAFDVSVYGTLPQGCFERPQLSAYVEGASIVLQTESTECAPVCHQSPRAFAASASFPLGLPPGDYSVIADGEAQGQFSIAP